MKPISITFKWFSKHKEQTIVLGIGVLGGRIIAYAFDLGLYPLVIWYYGLLLGGVIMAFLSFIVCLLSIWFYDWSKKDWLGIEAIKGLKLYDGSHRLARVLAWTLRRGDPLACVLLSVKFDPFITTAYMRRGSFNGMNRRDWGIFLLSWFIGNAYWAFACWMGVSVVEWAWKLIVNF